MAYINKEEVANVRKQLKENFKGWSFGCSKRDSAVLNITIKKGTADLIVVANSDLWYWSDLDLKEKISPTGADAIIKIKEIATSQDWFDKSDSMTDYFHIAYYIHIKVANDYQKIEIKEKLTTVFNIKEFNMLFNTGLVEPFIHTKTGNELKVMKLPVALPTNDFKLFNSWMKSENKGYYSRYAKGFILTANESKEVA
jgi:uncharacterized protein YneR